MRRLLPALLLGVLIGCGGGEPTITPSPVPAPTPAPAPQPAPPPIIQPDPALFDATFNAQLVHDAFEAPTMLQPARLLKSNPSIFLQTAGLDPALPSQLEAEARAIVPMLSAGMLSVASFTAAPDLHPLQVGAIVVELMNDPSGPNCGVTDVGALMGHIRLYIHVGCNRPWVDVFGHELGHALGFYHVADAACLMSVTRPLSRNGTLCDKERYHAGLAYQSNGAY